MSWVKKRTTTTPPVQPPVQMYNPNQHNQENHWQPQPHDNWYNQQNQAPGANYWQPPYNQNTPQFGGQYYQNNTPYQQPTYGNMQYNQQYGAQNNYGAQPQPEGDGWSSNWGWGDEDNSNVQAPTATASATVTESFTNDETWNWAVEEKVEESATAVPKRNKLETPQWSVESQLSQESSDDILQTSESDKSRMLSRSSTISHSPISGQEPHVEVVKEAVNEGAHFENKEDLGAPPPGGPPDDKGNPYKRSTGLSHNAANKFRTTNSTSPESRPLGMFQPTFHAQTVNLETLPDNSEQPDPIPAHPTRKTTPPSTAPASTWPENNEAPINDRNQYLETAQLSDVDYAQVPEASSQDDTLPPPGLRRMVPGQTVGGAETTEPPEGLRRMIPGESSSPESSLRPQHDSEPEFNERSATIGADLPSASAVNRSETIGADISPEVSKKRRDSVEGEITGLVRNLTLGDKQDDGNSGEGSGRRHSRQESSESERGKSPGDRRERRYRRDKEDGRDRNRGRYTPEDYRDKRRYKDRRYEEDTDYNSDKERERKHRDDYDRKYNSLRKDKDKDRRRRDDRDKREYSRKNDYYYGRYEDDYENPERSRASSRSDSVHDPYRERGNERDRRDRRREKERHRRHRDPRDTRDPFNPYMQGFGYDAYNQYYQQYHYYENLRKTNPQAYAQLYRKYYQNQPGETAYGTEDRASVHSGRSSANDELAKDRYTRQSYYSQTSLPHYYRGSQTHSISGQYGLDDSSFVRTLDQTDTSLNYEDPNLTVQRLTPAKFATAHIKAAISSGKIVKILPHYPLDGQTATVELCNLETLLSNDEEYQELKRFPGPLVKGTTHKKTIIEYCENKIKEAGHFIDQSERDSYVLMWELLILLIRQNGMVVGADIAELLLKNRPQERPPSVVSSVGSNVNDNEATNGTSLKEEEVTNQFREYLLYGSVKEALEWAMKHGLWGHALFLASKVDKRTYANVIMRFANGLTMNDPLQTLYQLLSGRTPAAVTCVADEKWGDWRPHLAMILSNSTQRPELNCKAITTLGDTLMGRGSLFAAQFCYLMTEVGFSEYETPDAKLVLLGANHNKPFVQFATNEAIHMTEIYEYARSLNDDEFILGNFQRYKYLLSTRLADVGLLEKALSNLEKTANFIVKHPGVVEASLVNQVALLADRLKYYDPVGDGEVELDFDSSRVENSWLKDLRRVQQNYQTGVVPEAEDTLVQNQDAWQQQYQQQWSPEQQTIEPTVDLQQQQETYYQEQQQYWPGQQQWSPESHEQQPAEQQSYYGDIAQTEEIAQPQISLPNQRKDPAPEEPDHVKKETPKQPEPALNKPGNNGWFGGIFSKLSLKPKNQMKLPDDKNPTILWDSEKKRWVNTDADHGDGGSDFKPPPKMDAPKPVASIPTKQENGPQLPAGSNMFKMQKSRNLKKSYIDVFNPNARSGVASTPAPVGAPTQPMNFFVPQPVHDPNAPTDFLTPAPPISFEDSQRGRVNKS